MIHHVPPVNGMVCVILINISGCMAKKTNAVHMKEKMMKLTNEIIEQLYKMYDADVKRVIAQYAFNRDDVDELAQEVWCNICEMKGEVEAEKVLPPLIYTIAHRRGVDFVRHATSLGVTNNSELDDTLHPGASPLPRVISTEYREILYALLNGLDAFHKDILTKFYILHKPVSDIKRLNNLTNAQVYAALREGLNRLQQLATEKGHTLCLSE